MTRKQKALADKIILNPTITGKQAVKEVFGKPDKPITDRTAEVMASEYLRKPEIMAYLRSKAEEAERTMNEVMTYSKVQGMDNPAYAGVAVRAAADILDRVHGKATQKVETSNHTVTIAVDLSGTGVDAS